MGNERENSELNKNDSFRDLSDNAMMSLAAKYGLILNGSDGAIVRGVIDLLISKFEVGSGKIDIREYPDLSGDVDGLYVDRALRDDTKSLYLAVLDSRKAFSRLGSYDFTDTEFVSRAKNYLEDVKNLFRKLFCHRAENSSSVLPRNIIRQVVESDIKPLSDADDKDDINRICVSPANPLVLASLYLTKLQCEDFGGFCQKLGLAKDGPRHVMYSELLKNKIERLFRDCIILYKKEFYRITDYDSEKNVFLATRENALCSIEQISAVRLYEKIVKGITETEDGEHVRCLVIGEVKKGSKEVLKRMLQKKWRDRISVEYADAKSDVHDILTHRDKLLGKISEYKKVFVLDCPEIYSDISLTEMSDDVDVINRSDGDIETLFGVSKGMRDFYNKNGFAAVYYRVQNYLMRPDVCNSSKARYVNMGLLNCLGTCFDVNRNANDGAFDFKGKEVYVYLSNNRNFENEMYDSYNFVRVERYNSKDCRIIKFSDKSSVKFDSGETEVKTTFYKILKMLSDSEDFFCRMTCNGESKKDGELKEVCDAIEIAQDTRINIHYSSLIPGMNPDFRIRVDVAYPDKCEKDSGRFREYKNIVEEILKDAFDAHEDFGQNDNRILFHCFQKAVANVISSCARNFNDLLFHHFYETLYKNSRSMRKFSFKVDFSSESRGSVPDDGNDEETTSYSYKRTAYTLMEDLDSRFYRESDIVSHIRKTTLNDESLKIVYAKNIKEACRKLGYTNSLLYMRLIKYYT